MNATDTIPIQLGTSATTGSSYQNTLPLLNEIAHALRRLHLEGSKTTLDLGALPFGPGDEKRLIEFLGRGEVSAKLEALGDSSIWESAYAGVWVIEHRSAGGERIAFQIEIAKLPGILEAQPEDIKAGLTLLQESLDHLKAAESV